MNVNTLKHALGNGANPSKFKVEITIPMILSASALINKTVAKVPLVGNMINSGGAQNIPPATAISVLAKATSLPSKSISTVDIWHRGHKFTTRGVATFPERWDVTFYNTADLNLRQFFEGWMYEIDRFDAIVLPTLFINDYFGMGSLNSGYMTNIRVFQLTSGCSTAGYEFSYAFPVSISETQLNSANNDSISEFTVTFAYSYWLPHNTSTLVDRLLNF